MSNLSTSVNGGESIRVIVRCRPMSEAETASGYQNVVSVDSTRGVIEVRNPNENDQPPKSFTFDAVYDQNSKQIDLYYESFRDLIDSVLNGFNGTIFAYGQTGTGKTHTMEGQSDDPEQRGVIPNAIDHIFQHIASANSQQQYLVRASYLEIYQDQIRDLLSRDQKKRLELKERPDRGVYVDGIESFITKSIQEIRHVQTVGNSNRSVGQTNMNEHSSRSHAIFIITIECSEPGLDGENHIRVGRLNLVDLAGSERQAKTGATGERLKEATKINLSLSALGNVISALVDGGKGSYVPYRDSKLTRLLQDSLGGNSKTVMVANVGPASYNIDETLGTLRYANRAKNIKNKPRINEDPKDAMLRQFQETIAELKQKLEKRMTSSRKRRRQDDPEVYKQKLDAEREELLKNNEMLSEEKDRMLAALEERAAQLAREREASGQIESKIREMESKLLTGGENLLDQTRQQQALLKQRKIELAEQKRKEREILQQLEEQDETTNEVQETFNNLQQEVEIKTKRLKKLTAKQLQLQQQIHETIEQNNDDRQQLESSISNMNKELKLKWLIVENFIPFNTIQQLKERYKFDDEEDKWVEVGSEVKVNFSKRPFARRLTTDHERQIMSQLRQRFLRQAPTIEFHPPGTTLTDVFNRPIPVHVTDEQMRFGTENLLNFNSLISCPLPVRDDYEQACREEMKTIHLFLIDFKKRPRPQRHPNWQIREIKWRLRGYNSGYVRRGIRRPFTASTDLNNNKTTASPTPNSFFGVDLSESSWICQRQKTVINEHNRRQPNELLINSMFSEATESDGSSGIFSSSHFQAGSRESSSGRFSIGSTERSAWSSFYSPRPFRSTRIPGPVTVMSRSVNSDSMHSTILSSRISTSMYALNGSIERLCDGRTPQMSTSTTLRSISSRAVISPLSSVRIPKKMTASFFTSSVSSKRSHTHEIDRHKRSIDRLIKSARLFVDQKSTCFVCRYTSVRLRSGIQKPNKRARDSCCCERWKPVDHSKPSIPIPLYDLSVFFGFLSLILQFTSWLLVV